MMSENAQIMWKPSFWCGVEDTWVYAADVEERSDGRTACPCCMTQIMNLSDEHSYLSYIHANEYSQDVHPSKIAEDMDEGWWPERCREWDFELDGVWSEPK